MATLNDAYDLFHEGNLAIADMREKGVRVDVDYCEHMYNHLSERIDLTVEQLLQYEPIQKWRSKEGQNWSLDSAPQMQRLIYDIMGHIPIDGKRSTDKNAINELQLPFADELLTYRKVKQARDTFIKGLLNEQVDGYVHPEMSLLIPQSFRSSCQTPNLQNQAARDKFIARTVRRAFIPRDGRQLTEYDFKGMELCVQACYSNDSSLIQYIQGHADGTLDLHGDMAIELCMIDSSQLTGTLRKVLGKGGFVFPTTYGDWWKSIAETTWHYIQDEDYELADGTKLIDHIRSKGIKELGEVEENKSGFLETTPGTWYHHVKNLQEYFWHEMFPDLKKWRENMWKEYKQKGEFWHVTGFRGIGLYDKNSMLNMPVQGCLAKDSKVLTAEYGWCPIGDLAGHYTTVWTGFNWANAYGVNMGRCQRANINLESGLTIQCDTRHKLKNEKLEWVEFDDLKIGDWVALPKTPKQQAQPSTEINWWFVAGFIMGDGSLNLHRTKKRKSVHITGGETKKDIIYAIKDFLVAQGYPEDVYGGVHIRKIQPTENRTETRYQLCFETHPLITKVEKMGFDFEWDSHTKRIPNTVWQTSLQNQRDFMEGLWLSDGNRRHESKRNLHMCNKELLEDVQKLIYPLGFDSLLNKTTSGWKLHVKEGAGTCKHFRLYPASNVLSFMDKVNSDNYPHGIYTHDYITDKRNFKACLNGENIAQHIGERMIYYNVENPEVYRYDRITSYDIFDYKEPTYTMSVDDPLHQFVADGVIHKNSSFHILLQALIEANRKTQNVESDIVLQVHDSVLVDHSPDLSGDMDKLMKHITQQISEDWTWINVPLVIEAERAPMGETWYDIEEVEI